MAVYTRYVDPDSVGGNGTEAILTGTNAAYVSLNAWDAAEQAAHGATDDDIVNCACTDDHTADITQCTIDGWTNKTTGSIQIIGNQTRGVWDATKYRIEVSDGMYGILVAEPNSVVRGVQIYNSRAADYSHGIGHTATGTHLVDRCIVRGIGGYASCYGLQDDADGSTKTVTIRNTVVYNFNPGIWYFTGSTVAVENCVVVNCVTGVQQVGTNTITVTNTYVGSCSSAEYSQGAGTLSRTTCAHSSATAYSGSTASVAYSISAGAYFTNVTAGSEDFNIGASSTLKGAGTDLSGTFTTDITGATRTIPWDIGAFAAAGGGQFARPVSDVAVGGWTASSGTDRYAMVDEATADDADYITSGATPSNDECVLALGAISTPAAGTVTLRVRMKYV